ncbi:MAG TPA: FecR domain-containing protein [Pyrinomonadaceae bacterium]
MRKRLFGIIGVSAVAIIGASFAFAQDQTLQSTAGDKWVITAKAGGVNHVQGEVTVTRQTGKSGMLLKGDSIGVGDKVATSTPGRAEILLNPGSYLRADANSAFEFKSTDLEDLAIFVRRGSVMLEVYAADDFKVTVNTPSQTYDLIETGVYRIDVDAQGIARLEVWKGKAEVGDEVIKKGRTASELDGQVAVAKFDRDERDDFEAWSRERAKELAKGTKELKDKSLRTSLMSSFLGGRWNMYDSFGLWVYNARLGRYSFLPFGYGWTSPYGFGFGHDIWWYGLPRTVYYYYPRNYPSGSDPGTVAGTPPTGGGTPTTRTPPSRGPLRDPKREPMGEVRNPPFVKMQGSGRGTGPVAGPMDGQPTRGGMPTREAGRGPVFSPPARVESPKVEAPSAPVNRGGMIRGKVNPD